MNDLKIVNDYHLGDIKKFDRYKENLILIDDKVISYTTHVATIKRGELLQWKNNC